MFVSSYRRTNTQSESGVDGEPPLKMMLVNASPSRHLDRMGTWLLKELGLYRIRTDVLKMCLSND